MNSIQGITYLDEYDLKKYLRKNLRLNLSVKSEDNGDDDSPTWVRVKIQLVLEGEVIAEQDESCVL